MEKLLLFIVICVVVKASKYHHPKLLRGSEHESLYKKVACNSENDGIRAKIVAEAQCGAPKEVFVPLEREASYIEVRPSAVWIKRCVGLCDHHSYNAKCVALEKIVRRIPVRLLNLSTHKESCATYEIEEHLTCGCCSESPEDCPAPRVYVPRKCACQCPNTEERRSCFNQRTHMRWNRYKCACEPKRRARH